MPATVLSPYRTNPALRQPDPGRLRIQKKSGSMSERSLAASMTREASVQTYFTIRYLADTGLVEDAYKAYAYFRWLDDMLDHGELGKVERLTFLTRQQEIISHCYRGEKPDGLSQEELLVADLIGAHPVENSGLRTYIDQMMAVMAFDANRKGGQISERELADYTHSLAVAVTEALHYFIGHDDPSPRDESRYAAVTGAHIVHMLRDTMEDVAADYYNIPKDYIDAHNIKPGNVDHAAYREWVRSRVKLARNCFALGREYLAGVDNLRCRLAGYAYIARFELIMEAIERDGYILRARYPERKSLKAMLKMALKALTQTAVSSLRVKKSSIPGIMASTEMSG